MFGPRITTVFKSRWKALFWSASVLMLAYCTVPSAEDDGAKAKAEKQANPWAKSSR